ncbi:LysR substrate-binding domain-containing protein [Aureimonas sp. Leaf324]|uniref:LysR substrate-binding domain-containing protein n=1 Tax=Aureimonas sp. Leaf324 TaxID=1736336 RepID=UPI0006F4FDCA|nr:LysR substrate-binding domain-containing protein [Aureimonas sp. Leaf324]KQQ80839.1 LysR family transcriptional regulator [Aureimonas sp. Leaf324]
MRPAYHPTIAELRAFVACMDKGSVTEAAASLNLTQSTVSRSLALLEDKLGVPLFHRVRKRLVPSDAGRLFAVDAAAVLARLDEASVKTMAFGGRREILNLAVLPTFAARWLAPRLVAFSRAEPGISLNVSARLGAVDFDRDGFDAAIRRVGAAAGSGGGLVLLADRLCAVASPELLDGREARGEGALTGLPLLQQATRPTLWLEWFREAGLDARDILRGHRFEQFAMVVEGAVAGLGVALVPDFAVERELRAGLLTLASPRRLALPDPYTLLHPPRSLERPAFAKFHRWLRETVERDAASAP